MKIFVQELPSFQIAFKRYTGKPDNLEKLAFVWNGILEWGNDRELIEDMHKMGIYGIGISYGEPDIERSDIWEYRAGIVVDDDFPVEEDVIIQEIAGGKYVIVRHTGPYSGIGEIYDRVLNDWMPSSNIYPVSDNFVEIFRTDPEDILEGICEIDICLPVMEEKLS